MLFHELYGSYYDAVAAVLREAVAGDLTPRRLTELVQKQAFSESLLTIPRGLQGEKWRLLRRDLTTPIQHPPTMPLTLLQRRWLKALLCDPRIKLFSPDGTGLEDVEPLFTPDMFVAFDRYLDGDDYADPGYVQRFHIILQALRERRGLFVRYDTGRGHPMALSLTPHHLEYSEKDDRFRLAASNARRAWMINLSRITEVALIENFPSTPLRPETPARLTFELTDRRNALERVLLHFSHLQKETEKLEEGRYRVTLCYDRRDETEMVIRILSFGPVIRVIEPESFIALLRKRIQRQATLMGREQGTGNREQE